MLIHQLLSLMKKAAAAPPPSTWTFTFSNPYSGITPPAPSQSSMSDGDTSTLVSVWAAGPGVGEFLRADFGSVVSLTTISVRLFSGSGWGAVYTNGATLDYSNDGVSWTTAATVTGLSDAAPSTPFTANVVGVTARYVRLYRAANDYLAAGDFYFT